MLTSLFCSRFSPSAITRSKGLPIYEKHVYLPSWYFFWKCYIDSTPNITMSPLIPFPIQNPNWFHHSSLITSSASCYILLLSKRITILSTGEKKLAFLKTLHFFVRETVLKSKKLLYQYPDSYILLISHVNVFNPYFARLFKQVS